MYVLEVQWKYSVGQWKGAQHAAPGMPVRPVALLTVHIAATPLRRITTSS